MLALYSTPLSANGRKALVVARHLELDFELHDVNVYRGEGRQPAYLAINPHGKVPTLVDGDLVLWESNAILQYLADAHGDGRLWPRDAKGRADVSRWLFFEAAHWQPAAIPVLEQAVGHLLLPDVVPAPTSPPDWEAPGLAPLLGFVEGHLEGRTHLAGDLTLADFSLAGMAMYLRPCGFPFERFPNLAAWFARVEALPAWRATAAGPWKIA